MNNVKQYFKDVLKTTSVIVTSLALIWGVVYAYTTWPSAPITIDTTTNIATANTVNQGDILTAEYYNNINTYFAAIWNYVWTLVVSWPHTEWWICAYTNGKILCNNTPSASSASTTTATFPSWAVVAGCYDSVQMLPNTWPCWWWATAYMINITDWGNVSVSLDASCPTWSTLRATSSNYEFLCIQD